MEDFFVAAADVLAGTVAAPAALDLAVFNAVAIADTAAVLLLGLIKENIKS